MKIEIGESLVYSWLRHEKHCQITQNNWKASPYWKVSSYSKIAELFDHFQKYYRDHHNIEIAKASSFDQFMKQAEIDAVGIASDDGHTTVYAIEVAFHEGGLNYKGKEDTISKLLQKYIRAALCMMAYFPVSEIHIAFVSPKINPSVESALLPFVDELQHEFEKIELPITIELICNKNFYDTVLSPVVTKCADVADTAEPFSRSIQLYQMFAPNAVDIPAAVKGLPKKSTPTQNEGKANSRIPKWAESREQNNHKIIRAFFQLANEKNEVLRQELIGRCSDPERYPEVYVQDFIGNFNSMKTDKGNSHGKVFCDDGYRVTIWEAVKETLLQYRSYFE